MKWAGVVALALGLALFVVLTLQSNWHVLVQSLETLGIAGLAILVVVHVPVIVALGFAWWLFGRSDRAASAWPFVSGRLVRDSVAQALPFSQVGGFVAGMRAVTLADVNPVRCGLSMFADLIAEFVGLVPYVGLGLLVLYMLLPGSALLRPLSLGAAGVAILVGIVVFQWRRIGGWIDYSVRTLVGTWSQRTPAELGDFRTAVRELLSSRRLLLANLVLHAGSWAFGAVETWAAFALMHTHVTFAQAVVIDSIASALRIAAFMVPAAAGVQEGCYVLVCALFGVSSAAALAFSLVWRARDTVIAIPGLALWQSLEVTARLRRLRAEEALPAAAPAAENVLPLRLESAGISPTQQ
jgi:putative membrane protein